MEAVAKSDTPVSLGELTELLGIDRSSVFRLANTLKRYGFIACPADRNDYMLGSAVWRLAQQYDWSNVLIRISREHLKQLASQTTETVHLAIRVGKEALFIDHILANHLITVSGQTGELAPLYCTAHGRALLADCDLKKLTSIFGSRPLKPYTKHTVTALPQLAELCAQIRVQGYATDKSEFDESVRCVAAPIRAEGAIIGSVGISAPLARFPEERYHTCGEQVRKIALEISALVAPSSEIGRTGQGRGKASFGSDATRRARPQSRLAIRT